MLLLLVSLRTQALRQVRAFNGWFYHLVDDIISPKVIAYTTNRYHILFILCLWLALLVCGPLTAFELVGGNYTNGLSALSACVILIQQLKLQQAHAKTQTLVEGHRTQAQEHHAQNTTHHDQTAQALGELRGEMGQLKALLLLVARDPQPPTVTTSASTTAIAIPPTPTPKRSHKKKENPS